MRKRVKKKPNAQVTVTLPAELVELCGEFHPECFSKRLPGGALSVVLFCGALPTVEDTKTLIAAQLEALEEITAFYRGYREQLIKDGAH